MSSKQNTNVKDLLLKACLEGDADGVRSVLLQWEWSGLGLPLAREALADALKTAVCQRNRAAVGAVLAAGREGRAAVAEVTAKGGNAVHWACKSGDAATLRMLLQVPEGATALLRRDHNGMSPAHYASRTRRGKDTSVLREMLRHKSAAREALLVQDTTKGWTPLMKALAEKDEAAAMLILEATAGAGEADMRSLLRPRASDGRTALHLAARMGLSCAASAILRWECGRRLVGKRDAAMRTPLDLAQENRHWDVVDAIEDCLPLDAVLASAAVGRRVVPTGHRSSSRTSPQGSLLSPQHSRDHH